MSAVIFDFDGTIADSFHVALDIFYEITGHDDKLTTEDISRLRGSTLLHVAGELNIKPWQIPKLLLQGRRLMTSKMPEISPYQDLIDVLKHLHNEGHQLYIMSTNSKRNIEPFLAINNIKDLFIRIYGNVGIFSKAGVLRRIIKSQNLNIKDSWYVGDEIRDIQGAKKAGIRIISVSWGYNSAEILSSYKPTKLINSPLDILEVINS